MTTLETREKSEPVQHSVAPLVLAPLTDLEVFERSDRSNYSIAQSARGGQYEPGHYWHDYWGRDLEANRLLAHAAGQRLYRHPLGLDGKVAEL